MAARSASGSTYVAGARARVAREGRIYVEGKHDAEPEALRCGPEGAFCYGRTSTTGRPSTQKPGPRG